ncbi:MULTISPECIES: HAMP domain-containing sensor histidine kinase [unclassified Crossiella]|uniref:sensor histidine kinase n=1 Tax=unclassified Crossiella TaxID=2620835 RepID=UPI0020000B8B|nr:MULTISPECIES: ATP-binding protein [unclassified Crossiella]MCK2244727.1 ATP-binding protein [Crossiella sp. S99.2]MCK2258275.1 ATP-binding protein [Crossiella sp. S99.1]
MTFRTRLTVLCGVVVLGASAALLGLIYLLVANSLDRVLGSTAQTMMTRDDQDPIFGLAVPVPPDTSLDQISALQEQFRSATLDSLLLQGTIAFAVVGSATVLLVWSLGGRALRPLRRITDTARRVADRSLHERIALDGPADEIKELADTFDTMLDRLDRAFDGQRRFVANASHELRTPLTTQRTLVEVAMRRKDSPPELRKLGDSLLLINERHERLLEGLLTLAHSENEPPVTEPVDLADLARRVTDQTGAEAAAAGVTIRSSLAATPVHGDPVLLERAVQNLVENGIRHNLAEDGWVRVETGPPGTISVTNSGAVITTEDLPRLFEPFRRLGGDRIDSRRGSGLGLSIVRSVAHAHGGRVTAEPRPGGGLTVSLVLPAITADS